MEYRIMENIGAKTSLLGFGCMRFTSKKDGGVNVKKRLHLLTKLIRTVSTISIQHMLILMVKVKKLSVPRLLVIRAKAFMSRRSCRHG